MKREEIIQSKEYSGEKGDVRRVIGIGPSYAPHKHTTDKVWVAYEEMSSPPKNKGGVQGVSKVGFPVFHCSLTAFRTWAKKVK